MCVVPLCDNYLVDRLAECRVSGEAARPLDALVGGPEVAGQHPDDDFERSISG